MNGCRKVATPERNTNNDAAARVFSDAGRMTTGSVESNATKEKCAGLQDLYAQFKYSIGH